MSRNSPTDSVIIEPIARPPPSWRDFITSLDRDAATNAVVAWLFAVTGPLAVLLAISTKANFEDDQVAAWIFGAYAIPGLLSVVTSYLYRLPSGIAWSIPGAILIGPALDHFSFAEVVAANIAAGILIAVLGISSALRMVMSLCPLPIVMGMVCAVFLPFELKIMTGFQDNFGIAFTIVAAFLVASALPAVAKVVPPVLAALAGGIVAVIAVGVGSQPSSSHFALVRPTIFAPEFSIPALLELVLPVSVTVIGIHNPQGFSVLESSGYKVPINALTLACGVGSILSALAGSVPSCVAGPSNAIMCSSGRADRRFMAGIAYGLLFLAFGIFAPAVVGFASTLPASFIGVLGGLALLRILQSWMATAFGGDLNLGALTAFLVTLSGVSIFHIGAPFWGLIFGVGISWLLERATLQKAWAGGTRSSRG
jgi:benzoate membrane transport protein